MRRTLTAVLAVVVVAGMAESVLAVFFDDAAYYEKRNFCQNHVWPWPYPMPGSQRGPRAVLPDD